MKTFYQTGASPEFQILYIKSGAELALLQGNKNWNWGEATKVEYLANGGGKVKEDIYYWQFRGHAGDGSPLKLATVAPQLPYSGGSTPMIDLNFTHKQLDSVVTKSYFGASTVTSREAYVYNDGTLLERKTETSSENKVRKTENSYRHDIPGLALADSMKKRNMRGQIAQISVKDNSNNGYSSAITTWRIVTHSSKNKFLPDKEFRWRNSSTAAAIPSFNWGAPAEGNGWILIQTFDQYDQHGNLTSVKDANNIATSVFWDGTGTLIDSIKTRPNSTLKPLTTKYAYDLNTFRLTAVTDPNNQKTEYKYDPLQRLIEMITPDKRTVATHSYFYSRQGAGNNDTFTPADPNSVKTAVSTHAEHVPNSDFENGSGSTPSFWTKAESGTGVGNWDNTVSFSGTKSLKANIPSASASNDITWSVWHEEKVSLKETYRMEVWVKTAGGYNGNAKFILLFCDNAYLHTESQIITIPAGDREWTKYTWDFTPLATTDRLYSSWLEFQSTSQYKGTVWYDRANFYELNITKTFADGIGRDIQALQREGSGAIKSGTVYDFASRVAKVTKPLSKVLFQQDYPKWKYWDLSSLTQKWINGTATNYGVILWATNENVVSTDLRLYSSSAANHDSIRPKLEVTWSTEAKTVYFLKDHLGSIRATVLDSAGAPVRGYDDYDSWGYPMKLV